MFKKEIFKIRDVDISCWRYERNLLVIFQCHWELVKIPHTTVWKSTTYYHLHRYKPGTEIHYCSKL